ncbi:hypothetical protein HW511_14635 [Asaia siamensis]|uniref:Uncharacterized protein n=1 Tax=Asaia siamensis TaxID=110479 RepID=A0ABQ1MKC5_9PROT|nr:hypothetical protein [Asaia siamensis]GBR07125.1 hypothetical protein AA0323_1681 [Asaia siamensis NRIC 0323]GGC42043.1 hypothetical protein GCM10007207_29210 [Asaia siamensis]
MSQLHHSRHANDNHDHTSRAGKAQSHGLPETLRPFIDLLARQAVREYVAANDNDAASVNTTTAR